jgi:hypothetical protein
MIYSTNINELLRFTSANMTRPPLFNVYKLNNDKFIFVYQFIEMWEYEG